MEMIKIEDFPIKMTSNNIEILAKMMMTMPPLEEWKKISDVISYEERNLIRERVKQIQTEEDKRRWESLTIEQQEEEARKFQKSFEEDSKSFRGNILQQQRDSIELERKEKDDNKNKD